MELIVHNKWKTLCDAEFSAENPVLPPDGSTVFVHMEHIYQFFQALKTTDNKYILVSADSDYCLTEQMRNPVWKDMSKWFNFIPITAEQKYDPVVVAPRCDVSMCRLTDLFSIKVYAFTRNTFDSIPENIVHWYTTNCDLDFPGIEHIPFGIAEWSAPLIENARSKNLHIDTPKQKGVYINFQSNTLERVQLKNYYRTLFDTYIEDKEIPHEEFVNRLLMLKHVVSPPGNGFDCFRTLEAIYCGAIPVILDAPWNEPYFSLPVEKVNSLFGFADNEKLMIDLEGTTADFEYWRNRISEKAKNFREHWH